MTFEPHLREVTHMAARNLRVVCRVGKSFDCPLVIEGCFNAYALSSLEYYASVWMSSADSHLGLLDSIVHSSEMLCEGMLCCLGHRNNGSALCLHYKIYHRGDHPMNEYLKHFVAACIIRASATLCDFGSVDLIDSVGRICLLLFIYGTCCRRACLVVAPWALLRAQWICAYWLEFYIFISISFCCFSAWYHGSGSVPVYKWITFPRSISRLF